MFAVVHSEHFNIGKFPMNKDKVTSACMSLLSYL